MQGVSLRTIFRALGAFLLLIVVWVLLPPVLEQNWGGVITRLFVLFPITLLLLWAMGGFVRIAMEGEEPAWAIIAQFGRPVKQVEPGIYLRPLWPFEQVALYPTGQKTMHFRTRNAHTKDDTDAQGVRRQSQPLTVEIAVYFRWPSPDEVRDAGGDFSHLYYRVPRALRNPNRPDYVDVLGKFFENAIIGAVRVSIAQRNHLAAREENRAIEGEVKTYLLSEAASPLHDLGIPEQCFDIELTSVVFPEDTQQALRSVELARREGQARTEAAKHRKEASVDEAEAVQNLLKAYLDRGVTPDVAAFMVSSSGEGRGMTIEQLRDLAIALNVGGLFRTP